MFTLPQRHHPSKTTTQADVAIVIVTYNSENEIRQCLDSIIQQRRTIIQQIIVVDNHSTDTTANIIEKDYPLVQLIRPPTNIGFAKGVNLGAKHADSDFILLLNPDTEILNHAIDTIVTFARMNPSYGLYGGRTLKPDGSLEPSSCWGFPTLLSMMSFALGLTTIAPRNRWFNPESLGKWSRDTIREVGVITGCYCLTTLQTWRQLNGMDERYFMYGEDVDFAIRARAAGHRAVICPDATLIHRIGKSSDCDLHRMILIFKGKATLVRNHWHGPKQLLGIFLLATGIVLRAASEKTVTYLFQKHTGTKWKDLWERRSQWLNGY